MRDVPMGIVPRTIWDDERLKQLDGAIGRYKEKGLSVPVEWIQEQNEMHRSLCGEVSPKRAIEIENLKSIIRQGR